MPVSIRLRLPILGIEGVGKECQICASSKQGPSGAAAGDILPVIKDRDFDHRHFLYAGASGLLFLMPDERCGVLDESD